MNTFNSQPIHKSFMLRTEKNVIYIPMKSIYIFMMPYMLSGWFLLELFLLFPTTKNAEMIVNYK